MTYSESLNTPLCLGFYNLKSGLNCLLSSDFSHVNLLLQMENVESEKGCFSSSSKGSKPILTSSELSHCILDRMSPFEEPLMEPVCMDAWFLNSRSVVLPVSAGSLELPRT